MKLFRLPMLVLFKHIPKDKTRFRSSTQSCTYALRCKYSEEALYVRKIRIYYDRCYINETPRHVILLIHVEHPPQCRNVLRIVFKLSVIPRITEVLPLCARPYVTRHLEVHEKNSNSSQIY
jgi:hypothetical protein